MRMQILTTVITLCIPLVSQAAGITDYGSHRPPSISLPAAGGSYVDPVFGTKITRVTDSRYGGNCEHPYSYWPAMNHEDTRILLVCGASAMLFKFNPANDTVTPDGTLSGTD